MISEHLNVTRRLATPKTASKNVACEKVTLKTRRVVESHAVDVRERSSK
jgi:hypothetical protein